MKHTLKNCLILFTLFPFLWMLLKTLPQLKNYEVEKLTRLKKTSTCPEVYTVKDGETIFSIAIKCGVDYKRLMLTGLKTLFCKKGDQLRLDIIQEQIDEVAPKKMMPEISTYMKEDITEQTSSPELILW